MSQRVNIFKLLKKTGEQFIDDNAIKLSASLSYYTVFAIAPFLIIIMTLAGIFFGSDAVHGKIYGQINDLVGNVAALQIQDMIRNIQGAQHTKTGAIIGIVALLIGATGVFTEIQDSINFIWCIKAKPKRGWHKLLLDRLLSFSLVVSLGFILLVSLIANALMDLLGDRLKVMLPDSVVHISYAINLLIIFTIISSMFAVIFKILPDARILWKDAFIGAFFTAFLFILGKFMIGFYLGESNIGVTYGAAASVIIILVWVYYSSIILFFGAEFTHVYATHYGGGVKPYETAVFIIKQEAKEITHKGL